MWKLGDLKAIRSFNTKEHFYLSVEGKGNDAHLEVKNKGIFGRIWMYLGFSNASMKKVIAYLETQVKENPPLYPTLKAKLAEKIITKKHTKIPDSVLEYFKANLPVKEEPKKVLPKPLFDVIVDDNSTLNKDIFDTLSADQKEVLGWDEPIKDGQKNKRKDEYSIIFGQDFYFTKEWKQELRERMKKFIQDIDPKQRKYDSDQEAGILIDAFEERITALNAAFNLEERLSKQNIQIGMYILSRPFSEMGIRTWLATEEELKDLSLEKLFSLFYLELNNLGYKQIPDDYVFIQELRNFSSWDEFKEKMSPFINGDAPKDGFAFMFFRKYATEEQVKTQPELYSYLSAK